MFDRPLSRRDMLRGSAAIAAAAALPSLLAAKDDDPFGGFTVAIQSYTFRNFNLEKAVAKIASVGVKNAEFFRNHIPVESKPDQIKSVLNLCKDNGVTPVAFGVEPFSKDHDANKKALRLRGRPGRQVARSRRPNAGQLRVSTSSAPNTRSPLLFTRTAQAAARPGTGGGAAKSSSPRSRTTTS